MVTLMRRIIQWVKESPGHVVLLIFLLWFLGMYGYSAYMEYQIYKNSLLRTRELKRPPPS